MSLYQVPGIIIVGPKVSNVRIELNGCFTAHQHNKDISTKKMGFYTVLYKVEEKIGKENRFCERYKTKLRKRRE